MDTPQWNVPQTGTDNKQVFGARGKDIVGAEGLYIYIDEGAPFFVVDRESVGTLWAKNHIYPTSAPWVVGNIPTFSPYPQFLLIYPNNSPQVIEKSVFSLHLPCSKINVFSTDPHFAHTDPFNNSRDFNSGESVGRLKMKILNCRTVLVFCPKWELCGEYVCMGKMLRKEKGKLKVHPSFRSPWHKPGSHQQPKKQPPAGPPEFQELKLILAACDNASGVTTKSCNLGFPGLKSGFKNGFPDSCIFHAARWYQNKSSVLAWPGQGRPVQNGTFVLMSKGGLNQCDVSPCIIVIISHPWPCATGNMPPVGHIMSPLGYMMQPSASRRDHAALWKNNVGPWGCIFQFFSAKCVLFSWYENRGNEGREEGRTSGFHASSLNIMPMPTFSPHSSHSGKKTRTVRQFKMFIFNLPTDSPLLKSLELLQGSVWAKCGSGEKT